MEQGASEGRKLRCKVRLWNEASEATGFTREVSASEIFIETRATQHKVGTRLHLEITLPGGPFFAEGQVVSVQAVPAAVAAVMVGGIKVRLVSWAEATKSTTRDEGAEAPLSIDLSELESLRAIFDNDVRHGVLLVETPKVFAAGEQVRVSVKLPRPHDGLEVSGTVSDVRDEPRAILVELAQPAELREKLLAVLTAGR